MADSLSAGRTTMEFHILPVTRVAQNCALLWCPVTLCGVVTDPGAEPERILAAAAERGITLERALLTHPHVDHANGARDFASRLGIPLEGPHRADDFIFAGLPGMARLLDLPVQPDFRPDRWFNDGDTIDVGNETLEVLHCPGHTPGHVAYFSRSARLAVVGDILFRGAIGRWDIPGGDLKTLVKSIRERLFPLGHDVRFIPGHGPVSTFGYERAWNRFVMGDTFRDPFMSYD